MIVSKLKEKNVQYTRKDIIAEFELFCEQEPLVAEEEQHGLSFHASTVITKFLLDKIVELQNAIDKLEVIER